MTGLFKVSYVSALGDRPVACDVRPRPRAEFCLMHEVSSHTSA